jgi:16S rRNA (guanine527-N7)-methyltransferase
MPSASITSPQGQADIVVSRAVAPLGKLVGWCLPLARVGGVMLAIKGQGAALEVKENAGLIKRAGGGKAMITVCGEAKLADPVFTVPATVVSIERTR